MKIKLISITIILICIAVLEITKVKGIAIPDGVEVVKQRLLEDGVTVAVHYRLNDPTSPQVEADKYANAILQYAIDAYNEIVYKQGFDTPGFTFANPDKSYCYDQDKTIDIYIGGKNNLFGFSERDFINAPCYDIVKGQGRDYNAVILFPADYRGYMAKWGIGGVSDDRIAEAMRGSLLHEMFHIISYSYNKNVEPWYGRSANMANGQGGDWYVEGLARYFETIGSSYDNFFSRGFVKREGDKVRTYQAGANYLMENPSEPLVDARYDGSLFWAYLHKRYGMDKIEEITRKFRFISREGMKDEMPSVISNVVKDDFKDVLQGFGVAMYFKYFNPDIRKGLNEVRHMTLEDFSNSDSKEVGSFASNFIWLDLNDNHTPDVIFLKKIKEEGDLRMSIIGMFNNGKMAIIRKATLDTTDMRCQMNLADMKKVGVKELMVIITNASPDREMTYRIQGS